MPSPPHALRTIAGVPGDHDDLNGVIAASRADAFMLDLGDLVAPARTDAARAGVGAVLAAGPDRPLFVRVAVSARPEDQARDLDVVVRPALTAVVLPECGHPDEVRSLDRRIGEREAERGLPSGSIGILPFPETALGLRRAFDILTASPRVSLALLPSAVGGDLYRDLGCSPLPGSRELLTLRSLFVLDARAAGIVHVLDGAWVDLADEAGFAADCAESSGLGFTGRFVLDDGQAAAAARAYRPSAEAVRTAADELAAYERATAEGVGSLRHDGRFVDAATAKHAASVLARAGEEVQR